MESIQNDFHCTWCTWSLREHTYLFDELLRTIYFEFSNVFIDFSLNYKKSLKKNMRVHIDCHKYIKVHIFYKRYTGVNTNTSKYEIGARLKIRCSGRSPEVCDQRDKPCSGSKIFYKFTSTCGLCSGRRGIRVLSLMSYLHYCVLQ